MYDYEVNEYYPAYEVNGWPVGMTDEEMAEATWADREAELAEIDDLYEQAIMDAETETLAMLRAAVKADDEHSRERQAVADAIADGILTVISETCPGVVTYEDRHGTQYYYVDGLNAWIVAD